MIATVRLFSASVHDSKAIGDIAGYYYGEKVEGYYTVTPQSRGYWFGSGIQHLELDGAVKRQALFHLLRGRDPVTKMPLVRLQKKTVDNKRKYGQDRCGLDLTFSVPKSVSLLWAFSSKEQRAIIERCVLSAIEETIVQIEQNCPLVRTGKGGMKWTTGKLISAIFLHLTARNENEPNIHGHVVIPNVVVTEEGKTQKINTQALLPFIRMCGPLFRNNLLSQLSQELGVEAYIPMQGEKQSEWFELKGMTKPLLRAFSSRRREIEGKVASFGYSHASSAATQNANFATRKPKGAEVPIEELQPKWEQKAASHGFSKQMTQQMIGHSVTPVSQPEIESAIKDAIKQIHEHEAVFDRWKLVRKTSELLQDRPISGAQVIESVDQYLGQSQDLVLTTVKNGQRVYSTQAISKMEIETVQCVERMAAKPGLAVAEKHIEKAIKRSSVKLSDEQEQCIRGILSAKSSIASVVGHAGAGKTTILKVIVDAYELAGKRVFGTSIGGVAVDKIRESINRETRTLASYLREFERSKLNDMGKATFHHARMYARALRKKSTWSKEKKKAPIDKSSVFLADEAGMIDLLTMHPFLTELERRGASVVFIGDSAQLQPVGPGNPILHINTRVNVHELKHNWRQSAEEAKAALQVREGNTKEALQSYADRGDFIVAKSRDLIFERIVDDWANQDSARSVVLAQKNHEVDQLNELCQLRQYKKGHIQGSGSEVNGRSFYKGDRVIFRETDSLLGIKNGYRGKVLSISEDGSLTIKIDGKPTEVGWKERLRNGILNAPPDKSLIKITPKQAAKLDLRLGYASTTHSYQGSQADFVFVLLGGKNQDRNISYVQLSRSVKRARLYVDRMHAGPELKSIIAAMHKQKIQDNVYRLMPTHELKHKRSEEK